MDLTIRLPDPVLLDLRALVPHGLEEQVRIGLAIDLFLQERISVGKGAEIAGCNYEQFLDLLRDRGLLTYEISDEDWEQESDTLDRLTRA